MTSYSIFLAYVRVLYLKNFSEPPANVALPAAGLPASALMYLFFLMTNGLIALISIVPKKGATHSGFKM